MRISNMRGLEDEIRLLKLRTEQLAIHLQQLWSSSPEALMTRRKLEAMVKTLALLEDERARLLGELERAQPPGNEPATPPGS
jgi:hypothetical protein